MKTVFLRSHEQQLHMTCIDEYNLPENPINFLKEEVLEIWGIPIEDQNLFHNGRILHDLNSINRLEIGSTIDVGLKIQGGKGGFGSLLRGQAISKRKITNFDASRDLQGRRIRNVKMHQKIMEWAKKKKEEDKMIKAELDAFKKQQKEAQSLQRDIKLTQEFKDKVEKWDSEMSSSIKAGLKKVKSGENEKLENFAEPKKKLRGNEEKGKKEGDIDSRISQKLASILEKKDGTETLVVEKEVVTTTVVTENSEQTANGTAANGKTEEKEKVEYEPIDLTKINSLEDLVNLGADHLKHDLMRLGLKSGGNLQERAKRLWDIKLKPELLFNPKYIAKK